MIVPRSGAGEDVIIAAAAMARSGVMRTAYALAGIRQAALIDRRRGHHTKTKVVGGACADASPSDRVPDGIDACVGGQLPPRSRS